MMRKSGQEADRLLGGALELAVFGAVAVKHRRIQPTPLATVPQWYELRPNGAG